MWEILLWDKSNNFKPKLILDKYIERQGGEQIDRLDIQSTMWKMLLWDKSNNFKPKWI